MGTITATIISAETTNNVATITLEFNDGAGKWRKIYQQSYEVIGIQQFKEMVAADVRRDLKIKGQLAEIKPLVGKTFTFTV
jgi:hypothetical protein